MQHPERAPRWLAPVRSHRPNHLNRLAICVPVLAFVAGCVSTTPLPTHTFANAGGSLWEARLAGDGACVWLEVEGAKRSVVWPAGFSARFDPLELVGPAGESLARSGDLLVLDAADVPNFAMDRCRVSQDVVIVGEVYSVNGTIVNIPSPGANPRPLPRLPR
jgi:hypothetical protein